MRKSAILVLALMLFSAMAVFASEPSVLVCGQLDDKKLTKDISDQYQFFKKVDSVCVTKGINSEFSIEVFGTEYTKGVDVHGKIFVQVIEVNTTIDDSLCRTTIYNPDGTKFADEQLMTFLEKGIYYYNFDINSSIQEGVFPVTVNCLRPSYIGNLNATTVVMERGSIGSGTLNDTFTTDGNFLRIGEDNLGGGDRRVIARFNFTNSLLNSSTKYLSIQAYAKATLAPVDLMEFDIYNYTNASWILMYTIDQTGNFESREYFAGNASDFIRNNTVRLRVRDTGNPADGASNSNNDIDLLRVQFFNNVPTPVQSFLIGTAEIHISPDLTHEILRTDISEDLISNHNVCVNDSLIHVLTKERCIDTDCVTISENMTEYCQFGCNNETYPNECVQSPFQINFMVVVVLLVIFLIIAIAVAWAKRG
jgi:hypothetical protein